MSSVISSSSSSLSAVWEQCVPQCLVVLVERRALLGEDRISDGLEQVGRVPLALETTESCGHDQRVGNQHLLPELGRDLTRPAGDGTAATADCVSDVVVIARRRETGVDAHPNPDPSVVRPRLGLQGKLRLRARQDGVGGG